MIEQSESITTDAASADSGAGSDAELGAIYDAHNSGEPSPSGTDAEMLMTDDDYYSRIEKQSDELRAKLNSLPKETREYVLGSDPPAAWSKDKHELWAGLPAAAQRYIAIREEEAQRKLSELGRLSKEEPANVAANVPNDDIGTAFENYRSQGLVPNHPDGRQLSAHEVIDGALSLDRALRQNPTAVIHALAQAHNVDLSGFGGPRIDPESVRQQVQQQLHAEYEKMFAYRQEQERAAKTQWLTGELEKFAAGKEDHWDKIENELCHQVEALKSQNPERVFSDPLGVLKDAYDRAVKQAGVTTKEIAAERKKKADAAKRAASLNVGARGAGASPQTQGQSWQQTMSQTYDRIAGRSS